ncbi:MAG TPA: hypothetical protein VEB86_05100 [Chryseosolibacter sp.]|nr:hypothetical protein [Chryseosolibacter sp.]
MAKATFEIVIALRMTADHLQRSASYQWGHMGSCNCGFLAQQITLLTREEIHRRAMERSGDWSDQLNDYCPASGSRIDWVIGRLVEVGFSIDDLRHLERLSDPAILRTFPPGQRYLRHNIKSDVVLYLRRWASLLEDKVLEKMELLPHTFEHFTNHRFAND